MRIKQLLPSLLLAMLCQTVFAQISLSLQTTDATCSSNGSMQVTVTGGSGEYNFQLSAPCLQLPIYQQSSTFNNLPPCQYTLVVTDGTTGAAATENVLIGGSYQSPSLALDCGGCTLEVSLTGGLAPFQFAISTQGLNGPFQINSPAGSPVFQNIPIDSVYWIRVTDACGNIAVESCLSGAESISAFNYEVAADGNIHVLDVAGGMPPYEYQLQSTNGSFSNFNGIFTPLQWGCGMQLTVSDECSSLTKAVSVNPLPGSICTNFAEGTATVGPVSNAVPPLTYICYTPVGNFSFAENEISGLPVNAGYYQFVVQDACGNVSDPIYKQKKYPIFDQNPVPCTDHTIGMYTTEGGCGGGFDFDSWPVEVACLSCLPQQSGTVTGVGDVLTFSDGAPGAWVIGIEDGCGDHMECHDSLLLEIQTRCDSVEANLIDRFFCENGTFSDRPMSTGNAVFVLKNASGGVLASNQSGIFHTPVPGNYTVELSIPNCGNFSASASVGDAPPINPAMNTYLYNAVLNGKCQPLYQLVISPAEGPYLLTGGPNSVAILLDESYLTSSCLWYSISNLLPGDYVLSPVANCGEKTIHLPAPTAQLTAIPYGNCPGSGTITVTGAHDLAFWKQWGTDNNATISWPNSLHDSYSLDAVNNAQNPAQVGSPFVFGNIGPGEHTVYLYNFNSSCPIDTLVVTVPEAETLTMDVSSGILCDGATTTSLTFEVLTGKGPYTIEQLDCNNLTSVLASYTTTDPVFSVPGFGLGDYCFRVVDSCVISLDHQFSVQYYQDDVEVVFNCDNTITLKVDSLNASYTWLDASGKAVGQANTFTFANPGAEVGYTVLVDIGECVITRSVSVPTTVVLPKVEITGQPFICEGASTVLKANSDASIFAWGTGEAVPQISATTSGWYHVTVTNGFGCNAVDSFLLQHDIPNVGIAVKSGGTGYGLDCYLDSNGILSAQPLAGFAPFVFSWSTSASTQTIENLSVGQFSVTITDSLGCTGSAVHDLTQPDLFVPNIHQKPPYCVGYDDGVIEVKSWSGGAGTVRAALNGSVPVLAPVKFDNLTPGHYLLETWDANGCRVDTGFIFPEQKELLLDLGEDLAVQLGDSIRLEPFLNFWPVDSFRWTTNDPLFDKTLLAQGHVPHDNYFYHLQVWDENDCRVEDKIAVRVEKPGDVYVPNAFSPNGDAVNDFFTVFARTPAIESVQRFEVFSRWGEKVFQQAGFQPNIERMGWDGMLEGGEPAKPGIYAWKAEVAFIDGRVEVLVGDVVLVR